VDLEQKSIERLKMASDMSLRYYEKPLMVTYSGGKDSDVQLELAIRSGIPFEVQNSHTTADAPETVLHIRKKFYELELKGIKCTIDKPQYKGNPISMWTLIPLKLMPPTRVVRYCCQVLKEGAGNGRMIATGVRWDESTQRSTRGGNGGNRSH
jgi:phosphoadenosine phosphosulfate reductase